MIRDTATLTSEDVRRLVRTMAGMRSVLHDVRAGLSGIGRRLLHVANRLALIDQRRDRIASRATRIGRRLDPVEG